MLKITADPTFVARVAIRVPGEAAAAVLEVTFRHMGVKALEDWWAATKGAPLRDAVDDIVEDIAGLHDAKGQPLAYDAGVLTQFLDQYHTAGAEILQAYFRELTEARRKN